MLRNQHRALERKGRVRDAACQHEEREGRTWTGSAGPKGPEGGGEHRSRVQWPMKTLQAPGPGQLELPYRNAQTEVYFSEFWRPQAKVRVCRGLSAQRADGCLLAGLSPPSAVLSREGRDPTQERTTQVLRAPTTTDGCARRACVRLLWTEVRARNAFHLVTHTTTCQHTHSDTEPKSSCVPGKHGVFCPLRLCTQTRSLKGSA